MHEAEDFLIYHPSGETVVIRRVKAGRLGKPIKAFARHRFPKGKLQALPCGMQQRLLLALATGTQ